ncbi:MAG: S41 family peptidase [Firmicutes bacterium]|nr:S41 family peptidase [Bacillota bacterium]
MKHHTYKLAAVFWAVAVYALSGGMPALAAEESPAAVAPRDFVSGVVEAVSAVRQELHDDYFTYFTEEEYRLMLDDYNGTFGGIGVAMLLNENNQIQISQVYADTPAARAGVLPGDIILAVDGESIDGIAESSIAVLKIRGDEGTEVTLTIRRENGATLDLTMIRQIIDSVSVYGESLPQAPGIAYIQISDFSQNTASAFLETYNRLDTEQKIKGLILDLRSNTGGSFYAALQIAGYFIPQNQVVVTEKVGEEQHEYLSSAGDLIGLPVAVLQNAFTASASEVLAGALADYSNTVLIGTRSFGKGITQALEMLPSGCGLRYTRSLYLTPSGFSLHGVGLEPDIPVEDGEDISAADYFSLDPARNPHLAAALDYFSQRFSQ